MTTITDPNVFNIAIHGTFDDGQQIVKDVDSRECPVICLATAHPAKFGEAVNQVIVVVISKPTAVEISLSAQGSFNIPLSTIDLPYMVQISHRMQRP